MRIAVLGGGNGCYAAAADLAEAGHEVRLWRRDAAALAPVVEAGGDRPGRRARAARGGDRPGDAPISARRCAARS